MMNNNEEVMRLLLELNKKLEEIDNRLTLIENHTGIMTTHIDFVENVYNIIKYPMTKIVDMLSFTQDKLPVIPERQVLEYRKKDI